ncbi:MFS transporter [Sporosarcina sp. SAFN-010]|uniref:MFS transporter n=1 Tax=Sporosarcina sp. SAFN-010 TaxID=3387273 RepID=UPI003F8158B6
MNKRMLAPTIISIAMATVMAGAAISPAIGLIASNFPNADPILIKLILTAPSLIIIPFSFVSSYLTTKISKRAIVMIGLTIYIISGVGAQFTNTIEMLLAFRFVLGAGVGLVMPLSISLISDHFVGREQVKMMGYSSAFSNLGGIVTMTLAGFLATFGWKVPFNVYWMGAIIFILVYFFLPKNEPVQPHGSGPKKRLPLSVYGYALASGSIMLVYYGIATNMALFLEQGKLGGSSVAGAVISFTTIGGMITSLTLAQLQDALKKFLIPISLLFMGLAFGCLALTSSIPVILTAVCFVGLGQGILFPLINIKALGLVNPLNSDRVIAVVSSCIYIGQFSSPLVLDSIARSMGHPTIRFQYFFIGSALVLSVIIIAIVAIVLKSKSGPSLKEEDPV